MSIGFILMGLGIAIAAVLGTILYQLIHYEDN